jgi:hypothetical protein
MRHNHEPSPGRARIRGLLAVAAAVAAGALWGGSVEAQFNQYIAPGELGLTRVSTRERIEAAVSESRWRLGPLRVDPWLTVHDVAWVDNVFGTADDEVSDLTATAGAGLKGYLPLGPKTTLALHALPEYVYWQDLAELRQWRGRYGVGLFGYFNRLTVEAEGRLSESQGYLSAELGTRTGFEQETGALRLEVDVAGPLAVFAGASRTVFRYDADPLAPVGASALDRTERVLQGGLRYTLPRGLEIGLGVESSQADFDATAGDRSNSGTGPLLELALDGAKVDLALSAVYRSLEAEQGSSFTELKEVSGDARLAVTPGSRLTVALYGARNLVYSALDEGATFLDERLGASVDMPLGWRTAASAFVESASYQFRTAAGDGDRRDDSLTAGARLRFEVRPAVDLVLGAERTTFDSQLPELDRTVTTLRTGLTVGVGGGNPW